MTLALLQTLPQTNLKDDWIVIAAAMIVIGLQGWQISNQLWLKIEVTKVITHLFGGGGGDGGQSDEVNRLRENLHTLRNEVAGYKSLVQAFEDKVEDFLKRIEWLEHRDSKPRSARDRSTHAD